MTRTRHTEITLAAGLARSSYYHYMMPTTDLLPMDVVVNSVRVLTQAREAEDWWVEDSVETQRNILRTLISSTIEWATT